ncbi:hypothetical protein SAMN05192554_12028 [Haloarchaeobius iranensis]|uniref:Uncharacterized protein n=1 Tax=Haloarchaeobius iranensis TaxID=996166 RepID=A0A1G9ZGL8_9EURY|nr:hypothetical protein SAMN05192554_12028 [Haloarchaeobius iranensis]
MVLPVAIVFITVVNASRYEINLRLNCVSIEICGVFSIVYRYTECVVGSVSGVPVSLVQCVPVTPIVRR